jgi:Ca2+-binding RTX toxin-like protein
MGAHGKRRWIGLALTCTVCALAALAGASAASAAVASRFEIDEEGLILLVIHGDESADHITVSCAGGSVAVNGTLLPNRVTTGEHIPCGGTGAPQKIEIYGEGGDDTIDTSAMSRQQFTSLLPVLVDIYSLVLDGGAGHNTLIGGPIEEQMNSQADGGNPAGDVISAGAGNDKIWGTEGNDTISGGPGEDGIEPLGGSDVVHGGPGADHIYEEAIYHGNARLYGEGGNDEITGGAGNDLIEGGPGNDYLIGHGGNDRILGGPGKDYLSGEGGNDVLIGGPGHDTLSGGAGHNRLVQ